ncbi:Glycoside hydrolase, superfamily [Penicillium expansum]|uniref:Glycoside hydrolase, superfamily n=1 Tax=Penicillium expansum TaxID=27334 RepID=A0A0A2K1F6_PENEN|nr:Glycoside hydrolase, superfamily [Penicillium expansum]KGO60703.1 Glycoside hydrolase, superfamily [Penicillium expansum]
MSIEFAYFPDYAGNKSQPNQFSKNLLHNLKSLTGVAPKVRVGGTSQDHATYFPDQEENVQLIYQNPTDDQPIQINYGPTFFESYHTLGDIRYLHGLNMAQNKSTQLLELSAAEACTSIGPQLHLFELGNEFNFAPGTYRPTNYSLLDYVEEWNSKSVIVKSAVQKACPGPFPGFMAPSFVLLDFIDDTTWTAEDLYNLGYDKDDLTKELCFHNYMGVNEPPLPPADLDLQRTLMNHTNIVRNLAEQITRSKNLAYLGLPYTLGELNSIANQGVNGETNVFGDALWLVDFSLWAAVHGIKRLQFHQGLNYRYASWQPIESKGVPPTTRPPYYGQVMVASAIGQSKDTRIVNIPLSEDTESAYAIYNGDRLSKLVVTNLRAFNQTTSDRPHREYTFHVPTQHKSAMIERLIGPGSDALDNITFGGISYDHGLKEGKPVQQHANEETRIVNGLLTITVPDSSAVLLTL